MILRKVLGLVLWLLGCWAGFQYIESLRDEATRLKLKQQVESYPSRGSW